MAGQRQSGKRPRRTRRTATAVALVALATTGVTFGASPTSAHESDHVPERDDAVGWVNLARQQSGVAPALPDPDAVADAQLHVDWMLANDVAAHAECEPPVDEVCTPLAGTTGGTLEGHAAATRSLLTASSVQRTPYEAVRNWLTGPFHAAELLSPRAGTVAYADGSDGSGTFRWAAALDVRSGFDDSPTIDDEFPLAYPGHGAVTSFTAYTGGESPDPLTSCAGYVVPTGAPVYVSFGDHLADRSAAPALETFSFGRLEDGNPFTVTPLEACAYDGTDGPTGYVDPTGQQASGRSTLAGRGMVVLIPQAPLEVGERYRYEVTAGGVTAAATFGVGDLDDVLLPYTAPFSDVDLDHPFVEPVRWLADEGITEGLPDGSFGTTKPVTRGNMAAFLYRADGQPAFTPPVVSPFADVPTTSPFYPAITWLADQGITGGYADGTFRPGDAVSRKTMAAFLHRYADQPPFTPPVVSPFSDVPVTDGFYPAITWLEAVAVTGGFSDGTFQPLLPVSRQAMAAFLYRYRYLVEPTLATG